MFVCLMLLFLFSTGMQGMLLKDISRQSHRWKVVVRLARLWEFRDQQGTVLYEVDFVAVDRQVNVYARSY